MNTICFLCEVKPATEHMNVPCAPGGKISLCKECADQDHVDAIVFDKYRQSHGKRIQTFKTPGNPQN